MLGWQRPPSLDDADQHGRDEENNDEQNRHAAGIEQRIANRRKNGKLRQSCGPSPDFLALEEKQRQRGMPERESEIAEVKHRRPLDLDKIDQIRRTTQQFRISTVA